MPPVHLSVTRRPLHRRALDVQVFAREDGLFDVEASLIDTKSQDVPLAGLLRKAGDPIHQMQLHLTVDATLTITAASSDTLWMPYPDACAGHGNAYARLVGLNLLKGFRRAVAERLSGTQGCTHLTELCQILPTAVIQAMAGSIIDTREGDADGNPPFQLDRCHALKTDGEVVRLHYPSWFRQVNTSKLAHNRAPMTQAAPQGEPPKADSAPFISS